MLDCIAHVLEDSWPASKCHILSPCLTTFVINVSISQVTSLNSMSSILEDALREYNETYATMDLVLFEDAMKHVRGGLCCQCIFSTICLPYTEYVYRCEGYSNS